jgi:FkbM family methyltransferase
MTGPNFHSFQQFVLRADKILPPSQVKVAFDLGSRDGEVALYLRDHYPHAEVIAFECNPPAIEKCREHFKDEDRVRLVESAVSEIDGPVDFYAIDPELTETPDPEGNIGASSLYLADPGYPHERYVQKAITVDSVSLASWARRQVPAIESIDVLWMDLQGAELRALQGMGSLLETVKLIYTEVEYQRMYQGQPLADEVHAFLTSQGFMRMMRLNAWEWFGDEVYCRRSLFPMWKLDRLRKGEPP